MKSKKHYYIDLVSKVIRDSASANLKVEEIAASIGVSKKTLYNHFDSKQQLMECVMDSFLKRRIDKIRLDASKTASPIAALVVIGRNVSTLLRDFSSHPAIKGAMIDAAAAQRITDERRGEILDLVVHLYTKGIRTGVFESDIDAALASKLYLSSIEMFSHRHEANAEGLLAGSRLNKVMYYMLKGSCSSIGLGGLREVLDLRVVAC